MGIHGPLPAGRALSLALSTVCLVACMQPKSWGGLDGGPDGGGPPPTDGDVGPGVQREELAGRRVDGFPRFTFVRSFHEDDVVRLSISAATSPSIVGQTCDVLVVEARTASEWRADPALVDARGRAQTETFSGRDLESNVVDIVAPRELPGTVGTAVGVGYDVVLDCDRDGQLGSGDLIDGSGEAAGFYVLPDITAPGPRGVTKIAHSAGTWLDQITYFPSDIASEGALPLVVVAHGWGHEKEYYSHLGEHLASYGYVVTSIRNDVGFGDDRATETASTTLLANTDYIIGEQGTIGGGVLDGHIDSSRIVWTGHSTGGECVVRAYARLHDGDYRSERFAADDIVLVSAIAPVAFLSRRLTNPYDVNFHLITGGADHDTGNYPEDNYTQNMAIFERATGDRHLTYVHGAGHGDFHAGPQGELDQPEAAAPDLVGPAGAHPVLLGYTLALVEWHARGNLAMLDYFERAHEDFRPVGIPSHVVISTEHRPGAAGRRFVIDDFQTEPSPDRSSSGGAVSFDVGNASEILMSDHDWSFAWRVDQPSNGMTRVLDGEDDARCVVFDWTVGESRYYELELVPGERDLSDARYLTFRAAQGTRHPETDALDAGLSFTVTLRDEAGVTSSIDFGRYGRVTRPYQRPGSGSGRGWANEFTTIWIPLVDFVADGSALDLGAVAALRFDFGADHGSPRGRIALDDIMVADGSER